MERYTTLSEVWAALGGRGRKRRSTSLSLSRAPPEGRESEPVPRARRAGCYQSNESQWLVMERLTGRELFEVILKHDALEECVARPILRQVCSALAYLHSNCIAHRDIKPENVIVLDDGSGAEVFELFFHVRVPHLTLILSLSRGRARL